MEVLEEVGLLTTCFPTSPPFSTEFLLTKKLLSLLSCFALEETSFLSCFRSLVSASVSSLVPVLTPLSSVASHDESVWSMQPVPCDSRSMLPVLLMVVVVL